MMRALVAEWLQRRRMFVLGAAITLVAFLVAIPTLGWVAAVNLGALALVVALVPGFLFDTGEKFPCGHLGRVAGCGVCDAGAIEFVRYDDGRVIRCVDTGEEGR